MVDENKLAKIRHLIASAEDAIRAAKAMLEGESEEAISDDINHLEKAKSVGSMENDGRVVEGVFDGLNMVGPDGKQYNVPANYASKSKLVEGDVLKLTISNDGSFVFKQIGPVDRKRLIGMLTQDEATGEYQVLSNGRNYKVLLASITYFKGEVGDEIVILVPIDKQTEWAAVENIVKGGERQPNADSDVSTVTLQEKDTPSVEKEKQLDDLEI
ncbi:hypothetical protein KKA01_03965 [Patescibacteria group bacterium]|nr:hypothetical protein [Patescibacteria group bacterium]